MTVREAIPLIHFGDTGTAPPLRPSPWPELLHFRSLAEVYPVGGQAASERKNGGEDSGQAYGGGLPLCKIPLEVAFVSQGSRGHSHWHCNTGWPHLQCCQLFLIQSGSPYS
jgi:hypothetical protein